MTLPPSAAPSTRRRLAAAAVIVAGAASATVVLETLRARRSIAVWDVYLPAPTERPAWWFAGAALLALTGVAGVRTTPWRAAGLLAAAHLATTAVAAARGGVAANAWGTFEDGTAMLDGTLVAFGVVAGLRAVARTPRGRRTLDAGLLVLAPPAGVAVRDATRALADWLWGPLLTGTTSMLPLAGAVALAAVLVGRVVRPLLRSDVLAAAGPFAVLGCSVVSATLTSRVVAVDRTALMYGKNPPWLPPPLVSLVAAAALGVAVVGLLGVGQVTAAGVAAALCVPLVAAPLLPGLWTWYRADAEVAAAVIVTTLVAAASAAVLAWRPAAAVSRPATPDGP